MLAEETIRDRTDPERGGAGVTGRTAGTGRGSRRTFTVAAMATLTGLVTIGSRVSSPRGAGSRLGGGLGCRTPFRELGARSATDGLQLRGMWLSTVLNRDWPSRAGLSVARQRAELLAHLDRAVDRRLNAVFFQVRPTADAFWPSSYEPWSQYLTGVQGRDPGGLARHGGARGPRARPRTARLVQPVPCREPPRPRQTRGDPPGPQAPGLGRPLWRQALRQPRVARGPLLRPGRDVRRGAVVRDRRRALGRLLDPVPGRGPGFDDDAAYRTHGAGFADRAAWRRDNIDRLVRETATRIPLIRPGTRFGISPFGCGATTRPTRGALDTPAAVQTYDDLYADTRKWVRGRWIDYIVPQVYWNLGFAAADYARLVPWWAAVSQGTGVKLYIGEALYKAGDPAQPAAWQDPAELSRHLTFAREHTQVRGHVFFSAKEVDGDRVGATARVVVPTTTSGRRDPRAESLPDVLQLVLVPECLQPVLVTDFRVRGPVSRSPRARPRSARGTGACPPFLLLR